MQKQAPSLGRILVMVLFALSCFGLLLFLWLSFGGPVPLKPKGYQATVASPEATQLGGRLGRQADQEGDGPQAAQAHDRDADDRPQVRAERQGHQGDPAPEDAA